MSRNLSEGLRHGATPEEQTLAVTLLAAAPNRLGTDNEDALLANLHAVQAAASAVEGRRF